MTARCCCVTFIYQQFGKISSTLPRARVVKYPFVCTITVNSYDHNIYDSKATISGDSYSGRSPVTLSYIPLQYLITSGWSRFLQTLVYQFSMEILKIPQTIFVVATRIWPFGQEFDTPKEELNPPRSLQDNPVSYLHKNPIEMSRSVISYT